MKVISRMLAIMCMLAIVFTQVPALADDSNSMKEDGFSTSYSYTYDSYTIMTHNRLFYHH